MAVKEGQRGATERFDGVADNPGSRRGGDRSPRFDGEGPPTGRIPRGADGPKKVKIVDKSKRIDNSTKIDNSARDDHSRTKTTDKSRSVQTGDASAPAIPGA